MKNMARIKISNSPTVLGILDTVRPGLVHSHGWKARGKGNTIYNWFKIHVMRSFGAIIID